MSGAPATWTKIKNSVTRNTILHGGFTGETGPFAVEFRVRRPTSRGLYVTQDADGTTINHYLPWPRAAQVKILDSHTWLVDDLGTGRTVWTIQR